MNEYTSKASKGYLDTGTRFPRRMIWAMGLIKAAAAKANYELGVLEKDKFEAIYQTALELARGDYDDEITVDVFQTGSGTGLNLNVNEVIAKHASTKLNRPIHPLDDVNKSQSSNDVVPTALRIMTYKETEELLESLKKLASTIGLKAGEYGDYVKPGRTHLRDALPVTFGMELEAYSFIFRAHAEALKYAMSILRKIPLGGTAVGTGANSPRGYKERVVEYLSSLTGIQLEPMENPSAKMKSIFDIIILAGSLKAVALDLYRLSQDLRLLYSGPFTGIAEIDIETEAPGSSIMPGKKNPVTLESIMQAVSEVYGFESSIGFSATLGELELFMGFPVVAYNIHKMIALLKESVEKMTTVVLPSIKPDKERMMELAKRSAALLTVLSPILGYDKVARIVERIQSGASLEEALEAEGVSRELAGMIDPRRMLGAYEGKIK